MLKREIRKWDLVLLMLNGIIGAGILGLPAKLFQLLGVYSIIAILTTSLVALIIAVTFARITKRFDASGGPYLYTLSAFGRTPAFVVGWVMLLSRTFTYAALLNLLISYTGSVSNNAGIYKYSLIFFVTISLAVINFFGIKKSMTVNNVLSAFKIIFLLAFAVVVMFYIKADAFQFPAKTPSFERFSSSALLLIFSLTGFEAVLVTTGEIRKPKKNVGSALFISLTLVAIIYSLVLVACIGSLPTLGTSAAPLRESIEHIFGSSSGKWVGLLAILSIAGTLNVSLLVGSRLLYSMAENNQLPKLCSIVHKKYGTPHFSIIIFSCILIWASLSASFLEAATISALAKVSIFLVTGLALIKFNNEDRVKSGIKGHSSQIIPGLCVVISLWLLFFTEMDEVKKFGAFVFGGVLILLFTKILSKIKSTQE